MGLFSRLKNSGSRIKNLPFSAASRWMDLERHQETFDNISTQVQTLATPAKPERSESFEQAVARHGLDAGQIDEIQTRFYMIAITFMVIATMIAAYASYLMFIVHAGSGLIGFALSIFSFGMAFRYHFWYTQIKHRRLGFTFGQWLASLRG